MKYSSVVFMQGEDSIRPLEILAEEGEESAMEHLAQWDFGEYDDQRDESSAGSDDDIFIQDGYQLSYNSRIGYIGLEKLTKEA